MYHPRIEADGGDFTDDDDIDNDDEIEPLEVNDVVHVVSQV